MVLEQQAAERARYLSAFALAVADVAAIDASSDQDRTGDDEHHPTAGQDAEDSGCAQRTKDIHLIQFLSRSQGILLCYVFKIHNQTRSRECQERRHATVGTRGGIPGTTIIMSVSGRGG
jgi:hypothetical protein